MTRVAKGGNPRSLGVIRGRPSQSVPLEAHLLDGVTWCSNMNELS